MSLIKYEKNLFFFLSFFLSFFLFEQKTNCNSYLKEKYNNILKHSKSISILTLLGLGLSYGGYRIYDEFLKNKEIDIKEYNELSSNDKSLVNIKNIEDNIENNNDLKIIYEGDRVAGSFTLIEIKPKEEYKIKDFNLLQYADEKQNQILFLKTLKKIFEKYKIINELRLYPYFFFNRDVLKNNLLNNIYLKDIFKKFKVLTFKDSNRNGYLFEKKQI